MNPLVDLLNYGQSYWLDNLTRKKITGGELKKRVSAEGLRGITSNPSIFNKAIAAGEEYEEQVAALVKKRKSPQEIYEALTVKDVRDACDILKPVYESSKHTDGFVSLEVSPFLARDTKGSIREAQYLYEAVGRPNCLIKIPGTAEGIPAIEQLLYEGININITLLFSVERYAEVAQAYIRALERRLAEGKPVDKIISVASVFLSRIDVLVDELIANHIVPSKGTNPAELLRGKAGVAMARLVYQRFEEIFSSPQWKKLEAAGAQVQKPLWASTGNKDPLYNELRYVEPLIGKNTVTTLPEDTITFFSEHGKLKTDTIKDEIKEAAPLFAKLKKNGIAMSFVTQQLENEGIRKFNEAYNELITGLAKKRAELMGDEASPQQISAGRLEAELKSAYVSMDEKQISRLLYANDPYLWKTDPEQVKEISQRLGWLNLPEHYSKHADALIGFTNEVRKEGYTHAVLLGMGGSSLCSEVARETFGTADGFLQLWVLDNTDPAAIHELEHKIDPAKTLFIAASKSGNTQETLSFFRYFYAQLQNKNIPDPGAHFVAITDDGTPLVKLAADYKFRKVFLNPPDLGGRYSVLSDFGLVPMALMGIDIHAVLANAQQMEMSCKDVPAAVNPGLSLGTMLGICQRHGRDKVTFVLSSSIASFGYWVEQLLAESTGKEGRGLIPVNGEQAGDPKVYGKDRVFVHLFLGSDLNEADEKKVKALEEAGHPVVRIKLADKFALGGEYYRWEIAAAVSGIVIGINSFDQPNVEESKKNTSQLLEAWKKEGAFKKAKPVLVLDDLEVYAGKKTEPLSTHFDALGDFVNSFTALAKPGDYIALLPYFLLTEQRTKILQSWRQQMRDELKTATTLLNGPRYLHSTGQLHKGGPDTGLYILFTGDEEEDLAIPGESFGFATLHRAQALGDFRSLDDKERRVIRIQLGKDVDAGLNQLYAAVRMARRQHI